MPSDAAAAAAGACASSSDEDTSDEAFAARHAGLEAEEQQRFNSFAGESASALCLSASWLAYVGAFIGFADFPGAQSNSWRPIPTQLVEQFVSQAHFCHSFSVRHTRQLELCWALNHRRHGTLLSHVSVCLEMTNRGLSVESSGQWQSPSLWRDSLVDLSLFPQCFKPTAAPTERHCSSGL